MANAKTRSKSKTKVQPRVKKKGFASKNARASSGLKARSSAAQKKAVNAVRAKPRSIVLSKPAQTSGAKPKSLTTTKVRVVNRIASPRIVTRAERKLAKGLRLPQYNFMRPPGVTHDFQVGDTVEVYCDHEKNRDRVRGWINGIVVQVDNKLVAVQFRSNVFLTDGWMVPDRILWYPLNSEHMRPVPGKKALKRERAIPDY